MDIKNTFYSNYSNYDPYENDKDYTEAFSIIKEEKQIKSIFYQRQVGIGERLELALQGIFNLIKSCFSAETTSKKHAWSLISTSLAGVEEKVVHLIIPPKPKSQAQILIEDLGWQLIPGSSINFLSENGVNVNLEQYVSHLLQNNFEGFTGIYEDNDYFNPKSDILLKNPKDLDNLIQLLGALGLEQLQDQLIQKCNQLRELKDYYHSMLGFPVDLLESLSFTTLVLNQYESFGDVNSYDDSRQEHLYHRGSALVDSYTLLKSYCYTEKDVPIKAWSPIYDFPSNLHQQDNYNQFIQARTQRGYALTYNKGFTFLHFNRSDLRGFLNLSKLLKECLNEEMCLRDTASHYLHLLFPYGFHLVKLEGDERTNEERLRALGTIGQKFLG